MFPKKICQGIIKSGKNKGKRCSYKGICKKNDNYFCKIHYKKGKYFVVKKEEEKEDNYRSSKPVKYSTRTRSSNGKNEDKDIKYIIKSINEDNELGRKLKDNLFINYGIQIVRATERNGGNREKHYDFLVYDDHGKVYKVEHKGSKDNKKILRSDKPWKNGVQFFNIGCEKYGITKIYAKLWYDQYIGSGELSKKYDISEKIPTFKEWYKKDCITQGNPKTPFSIQLKKLTKKIKRQKGVGSVLNDLKPKINEELNLILEEEPKVLDKFKSTLLGLIQKSLYEKDLWLQISGDLTTSDVTFMWYEKIEIDQIDDISFSHKSDFDFHVKCSNGIELNPKLRWGKGPYSNLRIDLK